jgi:hypothetical protein
MARQQGINTSPSREITTATPETSIHHAIYHQLSIAINTIACSLQTGGYQSVAEGFTETLIDEAALCLDTTRIEKLNWGSSARHVFPAGRIVRKPN